MLKPILLGLILLAQTQAGSGTLTGRVLTQEGTPAVNVRVAVMTVDDGALSNIAQTDTEGRYRLENVRTGRYYISAGPVGFPTYFPGVDRTGNPTVVNVTPGETRNDLSFTLLRVSTGVKISGTVVREGPLAGDRPLQVALGGGGQLRQVASAGADGKFEFSHVLPGRYTVLLDPPKPHFPQPVTVSDTDIEVRLLPRRDVSVLGAMRLENDVPRPRLTVILEDATRKFSGTFSSNGTMMVEAPTGEYRVRISDVPAGYAVQSVRSPSRNLLTESLLIKEEDSPLIVVALQLTEAAPWKKASGRITGTIPPNAKITLSGTGMAEAPEMSLNPDGSFEFLKLLPGGYSAILKPSPVGVKPFTFQVNDTDVSNLEFAVSETRTIRGRLSRESDPLPSLAIFMLADSRSGQQLGNFTINPDDNRSFTIALPAGEYNLQFLTLGRPAPKMTYGSVNLNGNPLRVPETGPLDELVLTFPQ
jgi:hypothetical protein